MIIRTGFVSNSSVSSFVLFGFEVDDEINYMKLLRDLFNCSEEELKEYKVDDEIMDLFYDKMWESDIRIMEGTEMGAPKNNMKVIGIEVAKDIEEMARTKVFEFDKEKTRVEKLRDALGATASVKIYVGNRMS
jgi:hypothetical protein